MAGQGYGVRNKFFKTLGCFQLFSELENNSENIINQL